MLAAKALHRYALNSRFWQRVIYRPRRLLATGDIPTQNGLKELFEGSSDAPNGKQSTQSTSRRDARPPLKSHNAATTQTASDQKPRTHELLTYIYEPHAKAINVTTYASTKSFLQDTTHPLHVKAKRKLAAFNPETDFHWRVHVPIDVSKKAAIRNYAKRKVKAAFRREMERRGFKEGEGLRGALLMVLPKNSMKALRFTKEELEKNVKFVLDRVVFRMR